MEWSEFSDLQKLILFVFHTNGCLTGTDSIHEREFPRMFGHSIQETKLVIEELMLMGFLRDNGSHKHNIFRLTKEGDKILPRALTAGIGD